MAEGNLEGLNLIYDNSVESLLFEITKQNYKASSNDAHVIDNKDGCLCGHYPSEIYIPICLLENEEIDLNALTNQLKRARLARSRERFVVPAIIYKNKCIFRSATLSSGKEVLARKTKKGLTNVVEKLVKMSSWSGVFSGNLNRDNCESTHDESEDGLDFTSPSNGDRVSILDALRSRDVKVLETYGINYIFDLMVEERLLRYGMYVASSEKAASREKYSGFRIVQLPYPGCEFFSCWSERGYNPDNLKYQWDNDYNVCMKLPEETQSNPSHLMKGVIKANGEKSERNWDLAELTKNYLRIVLNFLQFENGNFLVHCISGWDRTPLFISLIRLSLWADGAVNESLSDTEMAYFTLAYDWFLHGHQLCERISKKENVLVFLFSFLNEISSEEYSIHRPVNESDRQKLDERKRRLRAVQDIFFNSFNNLLDFSVMEETTRKFVNSVRGAKVALHNRLFSSGNV
ncbi:DgyrCDS10194 [Dimorphilus gyrociliatus]|uniref:DgyrCDS10194 n=1 Tax=Dimorphilus gyrociliatus TaxID=2664684 RepID=A0A7I8VZH8_9ANNE|nr:DgyrCDS10194 [Dimorphilus gyrociliatus]